MAGTDVKKCKDCLYRTFADSRWCCYYVVLEGHRRESNANNCKKYQPYDSDKRMELELEKDKRWEMELCTRRENGFK